MKHTAGEWGAYTTKDGLRPRLVYEFLLLKWKIKTLFLRPIFIISKTKDEKFYLAAMLCNKKTMKQDEENAVIMASAPDLLEALQGLGTMPDGYCFCPHERDPGKQNHAGECAAARAAITKANGEGK